MITQLWASFLGCFTQGLPRNFWRIPESSSAPSCEILSLWDDYIESDEGASRRPGWFSHNVGLCSLDIVFVNRHTYTWAHVHIQMCKRILLHTLYTIFMHTYTYAQWAHTCYVTHTHTHVCIHTHTCTQNTHIFAPMHTHTKRVYFCTHVHH